MARREYTDAEKWEVLKYAEKENISQAAKKFKVNRQSIYNWMEDRDTIETHVALQSKSMAVAKKVLSDDALMDFSNYKDLLSRIGTLEERKRDLAAKVEYNLGRVIDYLEKHPDLSDVHPKDLSKIMLDLNVIKKDLYNEPTVIVEYRNRWMEGVLHVLKEFLGESELRQFVNKMGSVEAQIIEETDLD